MPDLIYQTTANVCQTSYEYVSSTLATSTKICYNPVVATFYIFGMIALLILVAYLTFKILK